MKTQRLVAALGLAIGAAVATVADRPTFATSPGSSQAPTKHLRLTCVSSIDGKAQYRGYLCANCHGEDGKGQGTDAAGLSVAPTDLTTIAQRNGGKFESARVEASITRWDRVNMDKMAVGDTSEVMPLYGPVFFKCYPDIQTRNMHLANMVSYIKKLQVK